MSVGICNRSRALVLRVMSLNLTRGDWHHAFNADACDPLLFGYAHTRGVSMRRACELLSVARSTLHYQSRLIAKDAPVLSCMRTLSAQYPRLHNSSSSLMSRV